MGKERSMEYFTAAEHRAVVDDLDVESPLLVKRWFLEIFIDLVS